MWDFLWAHNVYDARRCWTITALTLGSRKKAQQKDNDTELLAWNIRCALSGHDYCGFPHCVYWIMSALWMNQEVTKQEAEAHVRTLKHSKYHVKLWKDRVVMKVGSFCFGWLRLFCHYWTVGPPVFKTSSGFTDPHWCCQKVCFSFKPRRFVITAEMSDSNKYI